jgi:hypothetical protein
MNQAGMTTDWTRCHALDDAKEQPMRRRKDECNPSSTGSSGDSSHPLHDNAFAPELFDELRERDFAPACPEGELPGPWRVTRLWGDGPPLWAVYGLGERAPRVSFDGPELADLAYLTAAAMALAERPPRFRFQAGADGRLHLMHDGAGVATVHSAVLENTSLATDLTRLADLRVQPLALAQFLASVPAQVLERSGAILMDELRKTR